MSIKYCLSSLTVMIALSASGTEMDEYYKRALNHRSMNSQAFSKIVTTDPDSIASFHGTNVPEVEYAFEMQTKEDASSFALKNPDVKNSVDMAISAIDNRPSLDSTLMRNSETIMTQPDKYTNNNGYCANGECTDATDTPNNEMIPAIAELESVLGGANSYSTSPQATVYAGKPEKCKIEKWGFADCCTDEGWGINLKLASCPKEYKELGKKKEKGLCVRTGEYTEVKRVAGIEVKRTKYKGYCCYPSKMARVTQQGGRPQLGLNFGSGKHPNCSGFTPDQFSRLDFSHIKLDDVYGDIQKQTIPTDPYDMTSSAENTIKDKGGL